MTHYDPAKLAEADRIVEQEQERHAQRAERDQRVDGNVHDLRKGLLVFCAIGLVPVVLTPVAVVDSDRLAWFAWLAGTYLVLAAAFAGGIVLYSTVARRRGAR